MNIPERTPNGWPLYGARSKKKLEQLAAMRARKEQEKQERKPKGRREKA